MGILNILNTSSSIDWLNTIEDEKQRNTFILLIKSGYSEDKIFEVWLNALEEMKQSPDTNMYKYTPFKFNELKEKVKGEFIKFVCGDKNYLEQQKDIIGQAKNAHKALVLTLATTIGA